MNRLIASLMVSGTLLLGATSAFSNIETLTYNPAVNHYPIYPVGTYSEKSVTGSQYAWYNHHHRHWHRGWGWHRGWHRHCWIGPHGYRHCR